MTNGDEVAGTVMEQVQFDIEHGFDGKLSAREGERFHVGLHDSDLAGAAAIATSDSLVVVPWRYPCTHTGLFLNVPATGVDFELRGTTLVDIRGPGEWTYYRYIDYLGALHQIGGSIDAVRPVVADLREAEPEGEAQD
jgi:hypothetical protein